MIHQPGSHGWVDQMCVSQPRAWSGGAAEPSQSWHGKTEVSFCFLDFFCFVFVLAWPPKQEWKRWGAVSRLEHGSPTLLAALCADPDSANITDLMPGLSNSRDLKSKPQRNCLLSLLCDEGCKLTLNCTRGGGRGGVKLTLPSLDPVPNCKNRFVPQSNTKTSVTLIQKASWH